MTDLQAALQMQPRGSGCCAAAWGVRVDLRWLSSVSSGTKWGQRCVVTLCNSGSQELFAFLLFLEA